jgi:hypothetical protein
MRMKHVVIIRQIKLIKPLMYGVTRYHSWLRHNDTKRKVTGSISEVIRSFFFQFT